MEDRLRAEIAELGATLEHTIWYAEGTLEWQVTIDDAKLAELLTWCETADGCRMKTGEDIARLFRYKGPD